MKPELGWLWFCIAALIVVPSAQADCKTHASSSPLVAFCDDAPRAEAQRPDAPKFRKDPKLLTDEKQFRRHAADSPEGSKSEHARGASRDLSFRPER
jgi:hypothetical protein